jgi:hypothetical protein
MVGNSGLDYDNSFHNEYRFLSNFYPAEVSFEGLVFPTVEHAYVAAKTTDIDGMNYGYRSRHMYLSIIYLVVNWELNYLKNNVLNFMNKFNVFGW